MRLLAIPLERDEGEYAYIAQLMLKGMPPYLAAYSMKLPGIFIAYAVNMFLFGQSIEGIHAGLLCVNALTILLVFLLARRLIGPYYGVAAGASFAFLALGKSVLGATANAEHFVLLPVIAALLLLMRGLRSNKGIILLLSGLCFGCAFIVKQHGLFFALFGVCYIVWVFFTIRPFAWRNVTRNVLLFCAGLATPFLLICLVFYAIGIFDKFWFWTFVYARTYVTYASLSTAITAFHQPFIRIAREAPGLWIMAIVGFIGVWRDTEMRAKRVFITGLFIVSFLAICPGLYFRPHYFIFLLPAISLLAACGMRYTYQFLRNNHILVLKIPRSALISGMQYTYKSLCDIHIPKMPRTALVICLLIAIAANSIFLEMKFLFRMDAIQESKAMYHGDLFPEVAEAARYIKSHSTKNDSVVVMGSEPEVYFYLDRIAPTGFIYFYFLTEKHPDTKKMQEEFIKKIEMTTPDFLVFAPSWFSEFGSKDEESKLLNWYENYRKSNYDIVGVANIISTKKTAYLWNDEASGYDPSVSFLWNDKAGKYVSSSFCVLVFERKTHKKSSQ